MPQVAGKHPPARVDVLSNVAPVRRARWARAICRAFTVEHQHVIGEHTVLVLVQDAVVDGSAGQRSAIPVQGPPAVAAAVHVDSPSVLAVATWVLELVGADA